jgi:hypothetical protein
MRIHEAIEKAGEGGRVRRKNWGDEYEIGYKDKGGWVNLKSSDDKHPKGERALISIIDAIEPDWEVVEPEIGVGDEVSPYHRPSQKCVVIGISCGVAYHQDSVTGEIVGDLVNSLTLIRKAPEKHVFEGVCISYEGRKMEVQADEWISGLDKKTYRMTLEPMED